MGYRPMPWQLLMWTVGTEVQSEAAGDPRPGTWAFDDVRANGPRQKGKTVGFGAVAAHRCGANPRTRAFMTAQKREKAVARWRDLSDVLTAKESPFASTVKANIGAAHEVLRWTNGSSYKPFAPNEDDMHGESPDLVGVDEQWSFGEADAKALMGAYVPGFLTRNSQAWKFSTAGNETSWWLNRDRRTGRRLVEEGRRLGVAYFEWSLPDLVDGIPLEELTDVQLVQACIEYHPARGFTMDESKLWSAWEQMADRDEFLRAYGNVTVKRRAGGWAAIEEDVWLARSSPLTIPDDATVALAFDVDVFRRDATVSAAWRDGRGVMRTELVERRLGAAGWLAPAVIGYAERNRPLVVATKGVGPNRDIADQLTAAGVAVQSINSSDSAAACGRHVRELEDKTWLHPNDPDLNAAAQAATWRRVQLAQAWDGTGPDSVTALASTTWAGWAFDHPEAEPAKPLPKFWMG